MEWPVEPFGEDGTGGERRLRLLRHLSQVAPSAPLPERICRGATSLLHVDSAALVLKDQADMGTVVADHGGRDFEDLQLTLGSGPLIDAATGHGAVFVPHLEGERDRWPILVASLSERGPSAAFALPLEVGAIMLGVLSLTRDTPGMLEDVEMAVSTADLAVGMLLHLHLEPSPDGDGAAAGTLEDLAGDHWDHSAVVHQATGMLAAQLDIELRQALARLRAHSFGNGQTLYEVSRDVVARRLRLEP
jgi:hypothetical protein